MKQQKTFSSRLVSRYLLIVRDEESFAEKTTMAFTPAKLIVIAVVTGVVIMALCFFLITTLLAKWVDPEYQALQTKIKLSALQQQIDSLSYLNRVNVQHERNIRKILSGEVELKDWALDTAKNQSIDLDSLDFLDGAPIDSIFRKEFEDTDYDLLAQRSKAKESLQQMYFFAPIRGIVTSGFDVKERHFGVDVVAGKDEPVKSAADGTVIMSSRTVEYGNVIAVQHKYQLISFYKHNSMLLKKVGDVVQAGEAIAIIGNSGEQSDGPHLHFELWYQGNPVNPEDFVHF